MNRYIDVVLIRWVDSYQFNCIQFLMKLLIQSISTYCRGRERFHSVVLMYYGEVLVLLEQHFLSMLRLRIYEVDV